MTLTFGQKHINLPKPIALTCFTILALSGNGLSAIAPETKPGNSGRKFGDACREQADCNNYAKYDFYEVANMTFMKSINELYELTFTTDLIMLTVLFISLFSNSASSAASAVKSFIQQQP